MKNPTKTAQLLKKGVATILFIITSFWFVFALLSGSEYYGGGLKGILMNSPNALPWLLLFVFVYLASKKQLIGGLIISLAGILTIFSFDTLKSLPTFLTLSLPLMILGCILIISWYLGKK